LAHPRLSARQACRSLSNGPVMAGSGKSESWNVIADRTEPIEALRQFAPASRPVAPAQGG